MTAEMHDSSGELRQETCRVQRTIRTWRSMYSLSQMLHEEYEGVAISFSGVFPGTVVLAVLLVTNDVTVEAGDAMDVEVILKRSSKGASESSGGNRDSEFACWYYERQRTSECRKMQRDRDM